MIARVLEFIRRHRRFATFCLVGLSGVAVNMAVFEVVLRLASARGDSGHGVASLAAICGGIVSVASNFLLNDRVTFHYRKETYRDTRLHRMGRYYLSAATGLMLQLVVLNAVAWLIMAVTVPSALASAWSYAVAWRLRLGNFCGIGAGTVTNYLLARHWVFR
jgi:dolichol-phosphate mannosyltransferase